METQKLSSTITVKPAAEAGAKAKTEAIDDERASLIRSAKLPSYIQGRMIAEDEERKEKELLQKKAAENKRIVINTKK